MSQSDGEVLEGLGVVVPSIGVAGAVAYRHFVPTEPPSAPAFEAGSAIAERLSAGLRNTDSPTQFAARFSEALAAGRRVVDVDASVPELSDPAALDAFAADLAKSVELDGLEPDNSFHDLAAREAVRGLLASEVDRFLQADLATEL